MNQPSLSATGRGFTLLEVLVAVSIFALIGLGTNGVLKTVINTRDMTMAYSRQISDLQRALAVIERDLVQLSNRGVRDELGDPLDALVVGGDQYYLEFTRSGWRNPALVPRSNVQRVAYELVDKELLRHYWIVLDRAEDSEPITQRLLEGVEDFQVDVITQDGEITYLWPVEDHEDSPFQELPARLELIVSLAELGEVRKLVNLVSAPRFGGDGSMGGDERKAGDEQDDGNEAENQEGVSDDE